MFLSPNHGDDEAMSNYWAHPSAEIDEGTTIGEGTKVWHHCQVHKGAVVGRNCSIGHNCTVFRDATVGDGSTLEANIDVWPMVTIGEDVFVGPSAVFTNDRTPRAFAKKHGVWVPTFVQRGASIGANATIVCGTTIGEYAGIAAGALVTKDVPPHALMIGVPARQAGWICLCNQWGRLSFVDGKACCASCNARYRLESGRVLRQERTLDRK